MARTIAAARARPGTTQRSYARHSSGKSWGNRRVERSSTVVTNGTGRFHGVTKVGQCSRDVGLVLRRARAPLTSQLMVPAKLTPLGAETATGSMSSRASRAANSERAYVPEPEWLRLGKVMSMATDRREAGTGHSLHGRLRGS